MEHSQAPIGLDVLVHILHVLVHMSLPEHSWFTFNWQVCSAG